MKKYRLKIPLAYKVYFIVLISVGFCAVIIGVLNYYENTALLSENLGGGLEKIAKTAALSINAKTVNSIKSTDDIYYNNVRDYLLEVKIHNEIKTPIYILRKGAKNRASLLVTTEPTYMIGASYGLNPTLKHVFASSKSSFSPIYTDKDGAWISAYAPIKDKEGAIAGVLELDYHIDSYMEQLRYALIRTILLCFIGLLIGTFLGVPLLKPILRSINTLSIAAAEMEKGNYDYKIELDSSDEIGNLALAFEHMRKSIKKFVGQLEESLLNEKKAYVDSIKALTTAIAIREPHMKGHIKRVSRYAELLARELGLSEHESETIKYGCMLHDIGKLGIDINILNKPSRPTPAEYEYIKEHPHMGAKILEGVEFLDKAREAVLCHQERYDGKGYPEGLKGEEIPISARIVAVVDAYDAMASDRPYREKAKKKEIIARIKRESGTQFDPKVVEAFLNVVDKF